MIISLMFLKIVIISIFTVFETFMVICVAFSFFVLKWKGIVFQRKKISKIICSMITIPWIKDNYYLIVKEKICIW